MNIVIIGRENVGKSTLFNTLLHEQKALTAKEAGTTRDLKFSPLTWRGRTVTLYDTAGVLFDEPTAIHEEVKNKIQDGIDLADIILFVTDGQTGIVSQDRMIAKMIQATKKPYILAVNKIDSPKYESTAAEFIKLGMGDPQYVSASSGLGTGDLLDLIMKSLPKGSSSKIVKDYNSRLKIALIGQPNVGKSSLLNAILGEQKVIVTDIPNTTREPNDIPFNYKKRKLLVIDTAGIRRKRQTRTLDALSMQQSMKTIGQSDISILVFDATKKLSIQDQRLAGFIQDAQKGIIVAINKWDLIEDKETNTINEYIAYFQANLPFLKAVPFIFVSAEESLRVHKLLDLSLEIEQELKKEIKPKELERFVKRMVKYQKPRQAKGLKRPRILRIEQVSPPAPIFYVIIRKRDNVHFSYIRFIENQLRDRYGFIGCPIQIKLKREAPKTRIEREKAEQLKAKAQKLEKAELEK